MANGFLGNIYVMKRVEKILGTVVGLKISYECQFECQVQSDGSLADDRAI